MSLFDDPPLRDFPDRAIRRLLMDPRNLRDLVADVAGELAAALDLERTEVLDRAFLLEDWRRRESDLLFRVPFCTPEAAPPALVCVLVEHQSAPDPTMPLRMLLYAVLYWERQWKAWEEAHPRGQPLGLTPVLPVVFHTGLEPWRTNRELAELFVGPARLRPVAPHWPLLFWELAGHSTEGLLASSSAWLRSLAVIRAEEDDPRRSRPCSRRSCGAWKRSAAPRRCAARTCSGSCSPGRCDGGRRPSESGSRPWPGTVSPVVSIKRRQKPWPRVWVSPGSRRSNSK